MDTTSAEGMLGAIMPNEDPLTVKAFAQLFRYSIHGEVGLSYDLILDMFASCGDEAKIATVFEKVARADVPNSENWLKKAVAAFKEHGRMTQALILGVTLGVFQALRGLEEDRPRLDAMKIPGRAEFNEEAYDLIINLCFEKSPLVSFLPEKYAGRLTNEVSAFAKRAEADRRTFEIDRILGKVAVRLEKDPPDDLTSLGRAIMDSITFARFMSMTSSRRVRRLAPRQY